METSVQTPPHHLYTHKLMHGSKSFGWPSATLLSGVAVAASRAAASRAAAASATAASHSASASRFVTRYHRDIIPGTSTLSYLDLGIIRIMEISTPYELALVLKSIRNMCSCRSNNIQKVQLYAAVQLHMPEFVGMWARKLAKLRLVPKYSCRSIVTSYGCSSRGTRCA